MIFASTSARPVTSGCRRTTKPIKRRADADEQKLYRARGRERNRGFEHAARSPLIPDAVRAAKSADRRKMRSDDEITGRRRRRILSKISAAPMNLLANEPKPAGAPTTADAPGRRVPSPRGRRGEHTDDSPRRGKIERAMGTIAGCATRASAPREPIIEYDHFAASHEGASPAPAGCWCRRRAERGPARAELPNSGATPRPDRRRPVKST